MDDFIVPACYETIDILYEDAYLLVINKPSRLLSLSGKHPKNKDSVHYRLAQEYPNITLVHRLDFGTSGVMLLAKNKSANASLTKQFQSRSIKKRYECILAGRLKSEAGVVDLPIAKDPTLFPRLKICHSEGKSAQSHFQVIERLSMPDRTRVIYTPVTGRTHQLRLHSLAISHPIAGCDLYGTPDTQAMAKRLLLHALDITILHPNSQKLVTFKAECPF